ncbi:MAG: M28 family peptidase, partial [Chrysiogenetes bacterium]|nr:M28 family peptidase [Chrysiogenetes bacterium]
MPFKSLSALLGALLLTLPFGADAAPLEQPAGSELMATVEALSDAWTNRGRKWAVEDRIEELGLSPYLHTEWIDWFTFHENLILEIPGSGDEIVYVTAHWDKVDTNPLALASLLVNGALDELVSWSYFTDGALDNGTGVAMVLALARHFAGRENHYTYRFVLTGAEEMGLRGARAHVARLDPDEVARIAFAVNLDTLARAGTRDCVMSDVSDAHLMQRLLYAARDSGASIGTEKLPEGASSDHAPFAHTSFW